MTEESPDREVAFGAVSPFPDLFWSVFVVLSIYLLVIFINTGGDFWLKGGH